MEEKGIYYSYDEKTYRADPRLNKSYLNNFCKGQAPRQALFAKETTSLSEGRKVHSFIEDGLNQFAVSPHADFRKKEAKEWKAEQEANGLTVIKEEELEKLTQIRTEVAYCCEAEDIDITLGHHEVTVFSEKEKVRLDYLHGDHIIDWKTGKSAEPGAIDRAMDFFNYDLQAFMYSKVYREVTGNEPKFSFVFVELEAPYSTTFVEMSDEGLALGEAKYNYAKERLEYLRKNNRLGSSYVEGSHIYKPAPWSLSKYNVVTEQECAFK